MSAITTSHAFLRACLEEFPAAAVLVVAHVMPAWVEEHQGPFCLVGDHPPGPFKSFDQRYIRASTAGAIGKALAQLRVSGHRYDIIYIDHHHSLASLEVHINGALGVAKPTTVFAFDDSVPPRLDMARAVPPPVGGWCGEVWMLPMLLEAGGPNFFVANCGLKPTGLLLARDLAPLDLAKHRNAHAGLSAIGTQEELHSRLSLTAPEAAMRLVSNSLLEMISSALHFVRPAPESGDFLRRIRTFDPRTAWQKPHPIFTEDLSGYDLDYRRIYEQQRVIHEKKLDELENVHLVGVNSLLAGDLHVTRNDSQGTILHRYASNYGNPGNADTGFQLIGTHIGIDKARLAEAECIPGTVLLGSPDEPDNWGMWLFLGLPTLHEFVQHRRDYDKLLCTVRHKWMRDLLDLFGITADDVHPHDRQRTYHLPRLRAIRHSWRDLCVTGSDRILFSDLRERFIQTETPVANGERIFVSRLSRTRGGAYRGLVNEEELADRLRERGFTVVEPEYLSFPQQVRLFAEAKAIVGLGGAGMFNVVFSRPGTRVVTIESTTAFIDAHTNIFGSAGAEYGVIFGREDRADPRPSQKRWSLDVDRAVDIIGRHT